MRGRSLRSLALAAAIMLCGLVWRLAPLHLPPFWFKYGGSALYAAMIYWLVAAAAPKARVMIVAFVAMTAVTAIECIKLLHTPALDAFRMTLAGKLILGRYFSWKDVVAYGLAIVADAGIDNSIQ